MQNPKSKHRSVPGYVKNLPKRHKLRYNLVIFAVYNVKYNNLYMAAFKKYYLYRVFLQIIFCINIFNGSDNLIVARAIVGLMQKFANTP